jgi:hypothetical protein
MIWRLTFGSDIRSCVTDLDHGCLTGRRNFPTADTSKSVYLHRHRSIQLSDRGCCMPAAVYLPPGGGTHRSLRKLRVIATSIRCYRCHLHCWQRQTTYQLTGVLRPTLVATNATSLNKTAPHARVAIVNVLTVTRCGVTVNVYH